MNGKFNTLYYTESLEPSLAYVTAENEDLMQIGNISNVSFIQLPGPEVECLSDTYIILLVITSPTNFNRRRVVRGTWLQHLTKDHKMKAVFLIGSYTDVNSTYQDEINSGIIEESEQYNDIIMSNLTVILN
jgi:hypothetical protein